MSVEYFQLKPGSLLPDITGLKPFLAVVIIEEVVTPEWRDSVSTWLVKSGCILLMAWGIDSSDWEDSVDLANIEQFNDGEIPEDELVMTFWQNNETLEDVFLQAKDSAQHACVEISNTVIVHIANKNKKEEYLVLFSKV
jgi:hypothetical protein